MPKEFKIEARTDLHGYNLQQAYERFQEFFEICLQNDFKNLLVITGKNLSSTSSTINQELPKWCENDEFSSYIKSIKNASEKHGGNGAYYIKLR